MSVICTVLCMYSFIVLLGLRPLKGYCDRALEVVDTPGEKTEVVANGTFMLVKF